jgi:hypothetical protein
MAKHFYQIDIIATEMPDEDELENLQEELEAVFGLGTRIRIDYVDSEG